MRGRYVGTACLLLGVLGLGARPARQWWRGSQAAALPAVQPEEPREEPRPVRLVAVGDLMLGTSVKRTILSRGPRHPFRPFRALLNGADLAFGNLETPLSDRGTPTPGKSAASLRDRTNFLFRTPPAAAEGLAWAGFDVLSVANNHTMDYGGEALVDTLDCLEEQQIAAVGGGEDLDAARAPVFVERNGQRIAFLGLSDVLPLYSTATDDTPGIAPARAPKFDRLMAAAIAQARHEADQVVVSVHWGEERNPNATRRQRSLGHQLVDWGADVVIGHHTHCLGPVERYGNGVIHYSLGNFIMSARVNVGAWEVTLVPGEPPRERSLLLRWDGKPVR